MAINQQSPQDAYLAVLDEAGCSFPKRDKVDADIVDDVRNGTAKYGNNGIIDVPSDVGGWPTLHSAPAPQDSDHDGMPDAWETAHGLNPHNAADRNYVDGVGYTMLEKYINSLMTLSSSALHVDDDAPNDPGPGNPNISDPREDGTADHPFDSIQEAIAAADDHATILVNSGTYVETLDFLGKNLEVEGQSDLESYPVIDANGAGPVVRFTGGEDPNCSLSGFELTGGVDTQAGAVLIDGASPRLSHCLIVGNRCTDPNGGAVYCRDSHSVFKQCTVSGNEVGPGGAAFRFIDSHGVMTNSIVWGNGPPSILVTDGHDPDISYGDIQGGWPGIGNIDGDPLFAVEGYWSDPNDPNVAVDPNRVDAVWTSGDYHLRSQAGWWDTLLQSLIFEHVTSPCIDAGDLGDYVSAEPEPNGSRVNLDAYGGTQQASRTLIYVGR